MDRGSGRAHEPFQNFDLIENRTILSNAPFVGSSVSKQAGADAAKPAQACDHRAPGSACAARSWNEQNGGASSAFVVVDVAERITDH
jgi:hypothetical protein